MSIDVPRTTNADISSLSPRPRAVRAVGRRGVPAAAALAGLLWVGLAPLGTAREAVGLPAYDRTVLAEIAAGVLHRTSTDAEPWGPEATSAPAAQSDAADDDHGQTDPLSPVAHMAPALEGIVVPIPSGTRALTAAPEASAAGYESNSRRQRPVATRGLSFSSGVRAAASGLDPALRAHAGGLRAQGREFVYGFLLLRVPPDEALERTLAGLGASSSVATTITTRPACRSTRWG